VDIRSTQIQRGHAPYGAERSYLEPSRERKAGLTARFVPQGKRPQSQPDPVLMARLLETAERALDDDAARARDCIASALRLLRPTAKPLTDPTPQHGAFARGGLTPRQIGKLKAHIEAHTTDEIRVGDLASMVALSKSHFIRAFKTSFGETPHAHIVRQRLLKAKAMMLNDSEPLARIAADCGFADQSHFCRRFRQATGCSPRQWRYVRQLSACDLLP
jgi:AraC family transcriptional regulator